jgi:deferrochelatase/peroxidase EfeB
MAKISRRTALKTLGLATGVAVTGGAATVAGIKLAEPPALQTAVAAGASGLLPFEGVHQAGIITEPPEVVLLAVLDVLSSDRAELVRLFKQLTERVRTLTAGQLGSVGEEDRDFPPQETGELGFEALKQGRLAITVGLGASLFEQDGKDRFGLAALKPLALKPMPRDLAGDRLDPAFLGGDLFLQISSDHPLYNLHALRDILRYTKGRASPRWVQPGFQRFFQAEPGQAKARGLLGFKDGTANLDVTNNDLMTKLVWTGAEEPAWAQGGTYIVARKIREQIERWDRLTLEQQENSIGRRKTDGASLDQTKETATPNYSADPNGDKVPLNSHIRKSNPRLGEESEKRRFLRRGYLYFNGVDKSGLLDAGFLFMCFCRNVQEQFEFVKRNYMTNRNFPQSNTGVQDLDEYLFCVGGGYFYAPPGVKEPDRFLADALLLG